MIVASELDPSTQRIVEYLLEDYGVPVNVVFFHYFRDGEAEYLRTELVAGSGRRGGANARLRDEAHAG